MNNVRLLIVEDHPLMRETLAQLVGTLPGVEFCGTAASAEEALASLDAVLPDVALVDVSLPGMNGLELVEEIGRRSPATRCVMLSAHASRQYAERAMRAGARGYVVKSRPSTIRNALTRVLEGESFYSSLD